MTRKASFSDGPGEPVLPACLPGEEWRVVPGCFRWWWAASSLGRLAQLREIERKNSATRMWDAFPAIHPARIARIKHGQWREIGGKRIFFRPTIVMQTHRIAQSRYVDEIVATVFLGKRPEPWLVHLDGDASNCRAENLAWSTTPTPWRAFRDDDFLEDARRTWNA